MSVTIKSSKMNYKDSQGNYVGVDVVAERSTEEIVDVVRTEGTSQMSDIATAGATALTNIQNKADEVTSQLASSGEMEDMIADTFEGNKNYAEGKYIIHTNDQQVNKLYNYTKDHTAGSWDGTEVREAKLADDVSDLKSALSEITGNQEIQFSDPSLKQYISTNGTTVSWDTPSTSQITNIKWAVVECQPGDKFTISGKGGNADRLWAFADSSKNLLDPRAESGATANKLVITAPEDAAYLIVNDEMNKTSYIGELLTSQVDVIKSALNVITEELNVITEETKLLADGCGVFPSEMVHGAGSSQNGSVLSGYDYRVTSKDIISFDKDVTLKAKTGFVFNLYFFTAQGVYDNFVQNQTSYVLVKDKKARITIKRSTENTSEIADIALFASSVYYEGEPLQRINRYIVDEEYTDFSGGYIATNTTPVNLTYTPNGSYKCRIVECSEGDVFKVTGSGSANNTLFAFLNSSDTVITKASGEISIHDLELIAPANTAKAVFNFKTSYDIKLVKNPASYFADKTNRDNEARIENTSYCFTNDDNLIENTKMVSGYLNTVHGDVVASASYYTTDYLFVPKDKTIRFEPKIRKFLAYTYPGLPIASSLISFDTQTAYEYTATQDCYVRVTIAKDYVGITKAKILPFVVDSAVIGANDLIEFATIQNTKKCTFSKSGRELTVATSENDTYCCVDILTNAFEADNLYYFDIDIKTATGSGKALRVLFLGTESNQNDTYSGVRTDNVSSGDKIKIFACAKKGCRGIRLFITGSTSGDATFVFNHLSIYKVLKINEPEKKKERRFVQPKARVSIVDDDGSIKFYQYLLPMIRTYGIPIATAYQGDNGYELRDQMMTREQLHEVEEAGGEIIGHGYNSLINLGSGAEADLALCKKMLNASGFFPTVYVYPYGDNNQNVRQLVEKYFDCSFKVATPFPPDYRTEAGCVPMFRLNRCHCGGTSYDDPVTTGRYANLDTASMDYFEALIQECITRKSWLVLYTHSWQMEEGQQPTGYDDQFDLMEAIIERILELKTGGTDIDIIKFEEGIEMFGNAFQAGDYLGQSNNDLTLHDEPGCAISKQGLYDFPTGNNVTPST